MGNCFKNTIEIEIDSKTKIYSIFVILALFGMVSFTSADTEVAEENFQERYNPYAGCEKCAKVDESCKKCIPCDRKYTSEECKACKPCDSSMGCMQCPSWASAMKKYGQSSAPVLAGSAFMALLAYLF